MNLSGPMQSGFRATICVNGHNYQTEESMPENIRRAFDRVISSALKASGSLFVGSTARFIPKLKSRIVCDSGEFGDSAEMPSAERQLFEQALAAMLPECIAERVAQSEARLQQRNKLLVALGTLLITTSYICYHGCLTDLRFLGHFIRFLCGQTGF